MKKSPLLIPISVVLLISWYPTSLASGKKNTKASSQWKKKPDIPGLEIPESETQEIISPVITVNSPVSLVASALSVSSTEYSTDKDSNPASPALTNETMSQALTDNRPVTSIVVENIPVQQYTITDIIKNNKRPHVDATSMFSFGSFVSTAITGLKGLPENNNSPTNAAKVTRIAHDADWAINEIAGAILKISDKYIQKDAYTLRGIIDEAKPYISNLREIVDLTHKKNVQLADTKIRQVQDTFSFFNMLSQAYATLAITEVNEILKENKVRRTTAYTLLSKKTPEDMISDDEYSDNNDLFDKIDTLTSQIKK
jgi:hypothetical protein